MLVHILIGIDPFSQPGVHQIYKFDSRQELLQFLDSWLYNDLLKSSNLISGKSYDIQDRVDMLIKQLDDDNELKYKSMNDDLCEYEYKWLIYEL